MNPIARSSRPRRLRPATLAALVALAASAAACQRDSSTAAAPEAALARFARALEQGDAEQAYGWMSSEYRARVSLEEFRRRLEQHPAESLQLAATLSKLQKPAQQEALLSSGDGQSVRLRREDSQWRVASDLVAFYDQSSPRAALASFVRAMRAKRYDVVLRFVPEQERDGVTPEALERGWSGQPREEIERLLSTLETQLGNPIEVAGNRATMVYGGHLRAQLVREADSWKIEDLE